MRDLLYLLAVLNVVMGFILLYRKPRPFRGRTFRDWETPKHDKEDEF